MLTKTTHKDSRLDDVLWCMCLLASKHNRYDIDVDDHIYFDNTQTPDCAIEKHTYREWHYIHRLIYALMQTHAFYI